MHLAHWKQCARLCCSALPYQFIARAPNTDFKGCRGRRIQHTEVCSSMSTDSKVLTAVGDVCETADSRGSLAAANFYGRIGSVKGSNGSSLAAPRPLIIGVAGGSASGKTSVCKTIIEGLKDHLTEDQSILSISQDCFYKDLPQGVLASQYNFDHPTAFDFEEIETTLLLLKQGDTVELPQYDYSTNARCKERNKISRANVILFDGILAFYSPLLRDLFDIKIFVDADADTRLVRRIKRDICSRGRDITQVLDQYESTVKPSFENYILPTKKYADIIIPRGSENLVAIDLILKHVIMKLTVKL